MKPFTFSQVNEGRPSVADAGAFTVADGIIYTTIFILVCVIVWLSNREIKISRTRIIASEKMLENEKNSLARRIVERTTEFVRAEEQRMIELEKNAEFGKLSQGLFHDLISPLSSMSLYAQQLDGHKDDSDKTKEKEMIQTVIESSRRMNSFMESVRRSFGNETAVSNDELIIKNQKVVGASVDKEINIVLDIIGYKARMAGVQIKVHQKEPIYLYVNPVRLHQLLVNLISNAIDACIQAPVQSPIQNNTQALDSTKKRECIRTEKQEPLEHVVTISIIKKKSIIELSVSDTGCGISAENQTRLFMDKFTTKKNGSGIGMMTIKTIVKQDLGGTIEVESKEGKGARFVVKIPRLKGK